MKAISAVIAVVLILMITVALGAAAYVFFSGTFKQTTEAGTNLTESFIKKGQTGLEIDAITSTEIYIRNTGQITLTGFKLYINNAEKNTYWFQKKNSAGVWITQFTLISKNISSGETAKIIFPPSIKIEFKPGDKIKITTAQDASIEKTLVSSIGEKETSKEIVMDLLPGCGNKIVGAGEECEDGNTNNNDACTNECKYNVCGDGYQKTGSEECDRGTDNGKPCITEYGSCIYCDSECYNATAYGTNGHCGDGITQSAYGEQCDDGSANNNNAHCKSDCTLNTCGDGYVYTGVEECDDNNTENNDACTNICKNNVCGDGYTYLAGGQECDDANADNCDGCSNCKLCTNPGNNTVHHVTSSEMFCKKSDYVYCEYTNTVIEIDSSNAVLDCNNAILTGNKNPYGILVNGKSQVQINHCDLRNYGIGIKLQSSNYINTQSNTISSSDYGIYISDTSNSNIYHTFTNTIGINAIYAKGTCSNVHVYHVDAIGKTIVCVSPTILWDDGSNMCLWNSCGMSTSPSCPKK